MQIQIENIDYCKVGVKYQADIETVKKFRQSVAAEMSKSYQVKGFRLGKASPEVIKLSYPKEVEGYLKQKMLETAVSDSISEKGIKPFGGPQVISTSLSGNKFEAEFSLHTLPDFELGEYKGFEIPKYAAETTIEEMTQKILQELRVEHGDAAPYAENDFVQMGDSVVVQYSSSINGEQLEDLSSEGAILKLGNINIPGFDDNLIGMKAGEEREFSLTTPIGFNPKYAEKEIKFKVKLMTGSKPTMAGLDDVLAQKIGLKDFEELNAQVVSVSSAKLQGFENGHYQQQVGLRLIANHDFKIPEWISGPESKVQAQMKKLDWEKLSEEQKAELTKEAEDGIKLSLILNKIQENEPDAQMNDEELMEVAKNNIAQYTQSPDEVMKDIIQKGQLSMFLSRIRDENTLNFIISNSTIVE